MGKLILRELRLLWQDRSRLFLTILVPLVYAAFYGSVFFVPNVEKIRVGLIDDDRSSVSLRLTNMLTADPVLDITPYTDPEQARADVESRKLTGYMIIPADFESDSKKMRQVVVPVYISSTHFLLGNELTRHVQTVLETMNVGITIKQLQAAGVSPNAALNLARPVVVDIVSLGNPSYGYGQFLLVGLMLIIIQQLLLISAAMASAKENEIPGTQWCQLANGCVFKMILGKAVPLVTVYLLYFLLFLAVPFPIFHLAQLGKWGQLSLMAVPSLLTITVLGLLLGTCFKKQIDALQVMGLTSVPLMLTCGYFWPYYKLAAVYKMLAWMLPTYPFLLSGQAMTQLGSPLSEQISLYRLAWGQFFFWLIILAVRLRFSRQWSRPVHAEPEQSAN